MTSIHAQTPKSRDVPFRSSLIMEAGAVTKDMVRVRSLDSTEASDLITGPGVTIEPSDVSTVFGNDILMRFWLPDGLCVRYEAEEESDYYGGSYVNIRWSLWR